MTVFTLTAPTRPFLQLTKLHHRSSHFNQPRFLHSLRQNRLLAPPRCISASSSIRVFNSSSAQFQGCTYIALSQHSLYTRETRIPELCQHARGHYSQSRAQTSKPYLISTRVSQTKYTPYQASFGGWTTVVALGVASGVYLLLTVFVLPNHIDESKSRAISEGLPHDQDTTQLPTLNLSNMTGEKLPGRPGNLTPAEEEKLLEMWSQVFQLFGVIQPTPKQSIDLAPTGHEHTEKKKRGLFGRKKKDNSETVQEEDKFGLTKQYHDAIANTSPELLRSTMWSMVKHDHPDALLLRFLRARKWDVEKAVIMLIATMNWRANEMHVDDVIMRNGEPWCLESEKNGSGREKQLGADVLAQMRMGKSYVHGYDKEGRPMCFVRVRFHKQGEQSEASLEWYTVFLIETTRQLLAPPVDTACVVFDMTGFSLANMDYTPVKFMIKCFEANYPESLGTVLVHKAPWVFQGIWKIIKGWLDPVVASKVNFTNNVSEMEAFVERKHIPKDLGGDEDWQYSFVEPVLGEDNKVKDVATRDKLLAEREQSVKAYEQGTVEMIGQAAGARNDIKIKREQIAQDLRKGYWKLDPYLRARSYYDRVGVIGEGGALNFYPGSQGQSVLAGGEKALQNGAPRFEHSADDID